MSFLALNNVVKRYGEQEVIKGVDLSAEKGEFVVFVGPSGCGKSTLLRMIAGLEDISGGEVSIDGEVVTNVEPARRQVSMVFQSYALYPHMSVYENMAFGLRMVKTPQKDIDALVAEAARILQIEPLLKRKPRELSGGQRQRVAIGRAIVRKPKLFLFDEPLSNLDAELRTQMRVEIAKLHRDLGVTMVYVTHDQVEAMTLADRIVVLRAGLVEQIGSPTELYDNPANTFVAGFIGSPKMNFLSAQVVAASGRSLTIANPAFANGTLAITTKQAGRSKPGDHVKLGLRPEHLALESQTPLVVMAIDLTENLGGATQIYGSVGGEPLIATVAGRANVQRGETVSFGVRPENLYLFDAKGLAL